MQVGTTEDQGLYNKPSAAAHPGELAAQTLPQYNTLEDGKQVVPKRRYNYQSTLCNISRWTKHEITYHIRVVHMRARPTF